MENAVGYLHQNEADNWLKQAEEMIADMKTIQSASQELETKLLTVRDEIQDLTMRLAEKQAEEAEVSAKIEENARHFQEKKELLKILVEL